MIWLERLISPDPAEREESIRALELLGDAGALPALAEVFATDPFPEIRMLAQQAGKTIYYGAIRQTLEAAEADEASEEERRKAAEVLAAARAKRQRKKRDR
jgi:hypothetical protein